MRGITGVPRLGAWRRAPGVSARWGSPSARENGGARRGCSSGGPEPGEESGVCPQRRRVAREGGADGKRAGGTGSISCRFPDWATNTPAGLLRKGGSAPVVWAGKEQGPGLEGEVAFSEMAIFIPNVAAEGAGAGRRG